MLYADAKKVEGRRVVPSYCTLILFCIIYLVDGVWGNWRETACTVTCGKGTQNRVRVCDKPKTSNGGQKCLTQNGIRKDHEYRTFECVKPTCPPSGE